MPRARRRGFSLVEILVIVAIISLGLIPIVTLLSHTAKRVSYNEDMVVANLWAVQLIERHRMTPFDILKNRFSGPVDASSVLSGDPILASWWQNEPMDLKSRSFLNQYEVSLEFEPDSLYPDTLGQLICRVTWTNIQGVDHEQERILLVEKLEQ